MNKKTLISLTCVLMSFSFNSFAQSTPKTIINNPNNVDKVKMYTWVDEKGIRHYTDSKKSAPSTAKSHTITTPRVRPPARQVARNTSAIPSQGLPPLPPSANMMDPPLTGMPLGLPPLPPMGDD